MSNKFFEKVELRDDVLYVKEGVERFAILEIKPVMNDITKIVFPSTLRELVNSFVVDDTRVLEYTRVECLDFSACDKLYSIPRKYFARFYNLRRVVLNPCIKQINDFAFHYCCNLKEINLGGQLDEIGYGSFGFCLDVKNVDSVINAKFIRMQAFSNCNSLQKLEFGPNVQRIESSAVATCANLREIIFNSKIKNVDAHAFQDCRSLKKIMLPNNITFQMFGNIVMDIYYEISVRFMNRDWKLSQLKEILDVEYNYENNPQGSIKSFLLLNYAEHEVLRDSKGSNLDFIKEYELF